MIDHGVPPPLSPGTARSSPTTSAPASTSVMNPLRRLRRALEASTCCVSDGWTELIELGALSSGWERQMVVGAAGEPGHESAHPHAQRRNERGRRAASARAPSTGARALSVSGTLRHRRLQHRTEIPQHAKLAEDHGSGRIAVEELDPSVLELEDIAARR